MRPVRAKALFINAFASTGRFVLSFCTNTFHILNADAALYAERGEECGDYAYDKLEHGLESFFV